MEQRIYDFIDLSDRRNVYAIGDVHGCFDLLRQEMGRVGFDGDKGDVIVSTGDLVDRGPQSHEAINWARKPWFYRVLGNHEQMTLDHLNGNSYLHTINGGGWLADMTREEQEEQVRVLLDAPFMLEVKTPKNLRVGFVHADLRLRNWQDNIDNPDPQTYTWSRMGVKMLSDPDYDPTVTGIDKVFYGHNAMHNAFSRGNCSWIDTGCGFADGKLTLVNVDTFGNILTE